MTQEEFNKLLDGYLDAKLSAADPETVKAAAREVVAEAIHPANREPAEYQREAIEALKALHVTDGTRPHDLCTRGDVMTMLFRFMVALAANERGASDKGGASDA